MKQASPRSRLALRTTLTIPGRLFCRLTLLRQRLEARYRVAIDEEQLLDYLIEKALERLDGGGS